MIHSHETRGRDDYRSGRQKTKLTRVYSLRHNSSVCNKLPNLTSIVPQHLRYLKPYENHVDFQKNKRYIRFTVHNKFEPQIGQLRVGKNRKYLNE